MTFIETIPEDAASGAWKQLGGAISGAMDPRRYELATVAAARVLRSSYCSLAHGKTLAERFLGPELRDALTIGRPIADA